MSSPRWLPALPARVESSPYLVPPPPLERPENLPAAIWKEVAPLLLQQVEAGLLALKHPGLQATQTPALLRALALETTRTLLVRAGPSTTLKRADEIVAGLFQDQPLKQAEITLIWGERSTRLLALPAGTFAAAPDLEFPPAPAQPADLMRATWNAGAQVMGGYRWEEQLQQHFSTPQEWEIFVLGMGDLLWEGTLAPRGPHRAQRSPEEMLAYLCPQLNLELLDYAWNKVYPQVLLGELVAEMADGRQQILGRADTTDQQGALVWGPLLNAQERPGRQLCYHFDQDQVLRLTLLLPDSLDPTQIRRLVLPVRGDRSYHDLYLELDTGHDRYGSRAPFVLENSRWMDALWTFGEPTLREQRTVYYSAALSSLDRIGPSRARSLTLELRQTSYASVLLRRFTKNYTGALLAMPFLHYLRNTLILVVLNILAQLLSCSLIAYGFARLRWPGRDWVFGLMLATMMLPPQVSMIPQFLVWRGLGQYDTFQPLWLPSLFGSGFFIFLMRQFMLTLPKDLEEAARIDGCGHLATYWHVVLPLLRPPMAAVGIFQFMATWNDFLGPLIYLSSEDLAPLSLGLFRFQGSHYVSAVGEVGLLMAASLLMTLPVILLFFFAQRYFIEGITFTGMRN
ncbi:MAG: carbohydrate ABC transporter permease [Candidatus Latescibacteria bacterium]|nr:carbohydrate ABC transporter permease [Candidatus Latescibacterota bacterium]